MNNNHLVWERHLGRLAEAERPGDAPEYWQLMDLIARTPAATVCECAVLARQLRGLIRPESLAPEDLEGPLIHNLASALERLCLEQMDGHAVQAIPDKSSL